MPTITADDGCPIHVELTGSEGSPALMLSNSLGTNLHMWDDQVGEWSKYFRVIRYDRRGHGQSGASKGPYSMERLGRDVLSVLDALGVEKTHWCGLSMGGMVGQWLGANAPSRISKLILSNTNSYYADKKIWEDRIRFLDSNDLDKLVDPNMERWFTADFRARAPQAVARMREIFLTTSKEGYVACCQAIRDMDLRASNPSIAALTLVIVGAQDPATPPSQGEAIAQQIKSAKLISFEAAHIANMEQPAPYTKAVLDFLKS
ncbi:3-oxoadipate enol-lactonase [Undibacter mobilis]|uniref:3-oxoadipate enol-lactonase n=1 Tax=Undibacter mobilis TaxID=2292256 RepID=A0A371BCF0_9BRAD|nr:3-oxoadipate enol-lactonase [Undibacter mobilis]RDV05279.1 3-oxoadipate enol-lactonase [Undibacter mobilis]